MTRFILSIETCTFKLWKNLKRFYLNESQRKKQITVRALSEEFEVNLSRNLQLLLHKTFQLTWNHKCHCLHDDRSWMTLIRTKFKTISHMFLNCTWLTITPKLVARGVGTMLLLRLSSLLLLLFVRSGSSFFNLFLGQTEVRKLMGMLHWNADLFSPHKTCYLCDWMWQLVLICDVHVELSFELNRDP